MARTHALIAMADAALYGALAGSVLFSLSPDAQRGKVLLYLLVSVAPFAVVAPAIGPTVDRIPGGRRMVIIITAIARALLFLLMSYHVDDVALYPLIFGSMVMQKTYAVSKSALVPSVVNDESELVEANSKLSLISGVVGAVAIGPLALIGDFSPAFALTIGAAIFIAGAVSARSLPRGAVAADRVQPAERSELRSSGIVLAAGAMGLMRAIIGFLTFHLFFWLREDYGLFEVGLAAGAGTIGSMLGNFAAPRVRQRLRERSMIVIALLLIIAMGFFATFTGGLGPGIMLALVVNIASATGRLAFDSIVQRDAPDANQGRAFAQFETRFQLLWVLAAVPPVLFTMPGQIGFLVVALMGSFAAMTFLVGSRAVKAGRPVPLSLTQRVVRRRRGARGRSAAEGAGEG